MSKTSPRIVYDRMEFSPDMTIICLSKPGELILPICPKPPIVTYNPTTASSVVTAKYYVPTLPYAPDPALQQSCLEPEELSCPICDQIKFITKEVYCSSVKGKILKCRHAYDCFIKYVFIYRLNRFFLGKVTLSKFSILKRQTC